MKSYFEIYTKEIDNLLTPHRSLAISLVFFLLATIGYQDITHVTQYDYIMYLFGSGMFFGGAASFKKQTTSDANMTSNKSAKPLRRLLGQIAIATVLVTPAIAHFEGYIQFQTSILVCLFIITTLLAYIAEELT